MLTVGISTLITPCQPATALKSAMLATKTTRSAMTMCMCIVCPRYVVAHKWLYDTHTHTLKEPPPHVCRSSAGGHTNSQHTYTETPHTRLNRVMLLRLLSSSPDLKRSQCGDCNMHFICQTARRVNAAMTTTTNLYGCGFGQVGWCAVVEIRLQNNLYGYSFGCACLTFIPACNALCDGYC